MVSMNDKTMEDLYKLKVSIKKKRSLCPNQKASLTVEASLVMSLFLLVMIVFLYFIQIFTIQEKIQAAITKMGLELSKTAYIYGDFFGAEEAKNFEDTIFATESPIGLHELARVSLNSGLLKLFARNYIDVEQIDHSCIEGGYDGLNFDQSSVMNEEDCIDIVVNYQMRIPVHIFSLTDMNMVQRVKLRGWTGYHVNPAYSVVGDEKDKDKIVYITEGGSVYHMDRGCSHIRLSIQSVLGVPTELRNDYGAKYYPCEECCARNESGFMMYYITSDGTRYHTQRDCPKLKRTVRAIPLSQVSGRRPCSRCGQ